ncbi:MAG TPA: heterodisulfide reductase-related iron-sulfur binding cluster, partial [Phenylobacterium sp.]|nr:heterodisulfide reductase-related iron-sulfur binding cluster [Phenylobacterium sp.]
IHAGRARRDERQVGNGADRQRRPNRDAIVTTAAGCGTALKGYGHLLRGDGEADLAASLSRDILEFVAQVGLPPVTLSPGLVVAYHAPCSLQHGQQIKTAPKRLLAEAGFDVREPREAHLCCGSAGVYNILQPELATRLRDAADAASGSPRNRCP